MTTRARMTSNGDLPPDGPEVYVPTRRQCRPHAWIWKYKRMIIAFGTPLLLLPVPIMHSHLSGYCAYLILWMGIYWMTEVIPMAATALMPMVLMPAFGIETSRNLAPKYINDTTMVIMGGMLVAVAVEKWNLHKRCALRVLMLVGSKPKCLMFGFTMVTGFLSMWLSNTATTAMLIPILEAVLTELERHENMPEVVKDVENDPDTSEKYEDLGIQAIPLKKKHLSGGGDHSIPDEELVRQRRQSGPVKKTDFSMMCQGLSLCIVYAANIGGISTLPGTAPNLLLKGLVDELYSPDNPITYSSWLLFAAPITVICLIIAWAWLVCFFLGWRELCFWCKKDEGVTDETAGKVIRNEYRKLGPITYAEVVVLVHFILLVIMWMARDPGFAEGWGSLFPQGYMSDGCIALFTALLLFMLPSKKPSWASFSNCHGAGKLSEPLLDWDSVHQRFPWGVIILFGGGFAMAHGCQVSGLSDDIGHSLRHLVTIPIWLLSLSLAVLTMITTEVVNNTATVAILLPVVAKMADTVKVNPLRLMIPCTVACSFAFMLPVATLPAAIVYVYGRLKIPNMIKSGVVMNILCIPVLQFAIYTWGTPYYDLNTFPSWAMPSNTTLQAANVTDIL